MAENNAPVDSTQKQDVDLDDIEVTILIIAQTPKNLSQTASFLSRRGWPTTVMSSVSQSVEFIAAHKPDFVLISSNHQAPALAKLPNLIVSAFNATCVGFAEGMDASSTNKLNKAKFRHKISGHASGPNLHRSIRKILAEKLNIKIDDQGTKQEDNSSSSRGDERISVKGGSAGDGQTIIQKSNQGPGSRGGVAYMPSESDGVANTDTIHGQGKNSKGKKLKDITSGETADSSGGAIVSSGEKRKLKDYVPEAGEAAVSAKSQNPLAKKLKDLTPTEQTPKPKRRAVPFGESGDVEHEDPNIPVVEHSSKTGVIQATEQKEVLSMGKYTMARSQRKSLKELTGHSPDEASSANGSAEDAEKLAFLKSELLGVKSEAKTPLNTEQSLLERMVDGALREICEPSELHTKIEMTVRVGVFPVDSVKSPGYLVLATPLAEKSRLDLFRSAEKSLGAAFKSAAFPGVMESGFWITLPEVDFHDWCARSAKFSVTLNHEGNELVAAFFAADKALPKVSNAPGDGMVTLELESISTDHPVTFKAYLHMHKNKKYYLYLRNGRRLQPEQKKRLKNKNVSDFYMKGIDRENIRMFLAAVFLTDLIKGEEDSAGNEGAA